MWDYTNQNELYHYGVKGMKWGIRKSTPTHKSRVSKPKKSSSKSINEIKKSSQKNISSGKDYILRRTQLLQQQLNQMNMDFATRAAINASLQASSLSMSGGANPFMFGMI